MRKKNKTDCMWNKLYGPYYDNRMPEDPGCGICYQ